MANDSDKTAPLTEGDTDDINITNVTQAQSNQDKPTKSQKSKKNQGSKKRKKGEPRRTDLVPMRDVLKHFCIKQTKKSQMFVRHAGYADKSQNWEVSKELLDKSKDEFQRMLDEWNTLPLAHAAKSLSLPPALAKRLIDSMDIKGYTLNGRQPSWSNPPEYRVADIEALRSTQQYTDIVAEYERECERQRIINEQIDGRKREIYDAVTVNVRQRERSVERAFIFAGPTNSAKTYRALEMMSADFEAKPTGRYVYAGPLRMLAKEVYDKMCRRHGEANVGYLTGEEQINPEAPIICCTPEMSPMEGDSIVLDETHWLIDKDRGHNWTNLLIGGAFRNFYSICATETADAVARMLTDAQQLETVECHRATPISYGGAVHYTKVPKRSAVVCFSEKSVLSMSALLNRSGISACALYGAMPLANRQKQIDAFVDGRFDVVVTTDVIGHGINLPIDNVVFVETEKFDGTERRQLMLWEAAQIAGRAGRYGISDKGTVYAISGLEWNACNNKLVKAATRAAAGKTSTAMEIGRAYITPKLDDMPSDMKPNELRYALTCWRKKAKNEQYGYDIAPSLMPQRYAILESAKQYIGRSEFPSALDDDWHGVTTENLWELSGSPLDPESDVLYSIVRFVTEEDMDGSTVLREAFDDIVSMGVRYKKPKRQSYTDYLFNLEHAYKQLSQIKTIGNTFGTLGTLGADELAWTMEKIETALWEALCVVERDNGIGVCRTCGKPCAPWFSECDSCHNARRAWYYDDYHFF